MKFPLEPGDYTPQDAAVTLDGERVTVGGYEPLLEWCAERGIDPHDVYRVRSFTGGVLVYRLRNDREGRKYLSRVKRWFGLLTLGSPIKDAARRLPKFVLS